MSIVQSSYSNTTNTRKNKLKNQISSGHLSPHLWLFGQAHLFFLERLALDSERIFCFGLGLSDGSDLILQVLLARMNWKASGTKTHHQSWPKATLLYLVLLLLQHRSCPLRWTQLCKLPQSFSGLHGLTSQTVPLQLLFLLLKHGTLPSKWIGNSCKLFLQNNVGHLSNTTLSVYSTISWADPYGTAGLPSFPVKGWFQLPKLTRMDQQHAKAASGWNPAQGHRRCQQDTKAFSPRGSWPRSHLWTSRGELFRKGLVYTIYILYSLGPAKALQQQSVKRNKGPLVK